MQRYQSFIRFLEFIGSVPSSGQVPDASRLKKIANAEFAMAENGMLSIEGYEYTKNEVLLELEHPRFAERLHFHQRIWDCKSLLLFLEQESLHLQQIGEWEPFCPDEDFIAFVSPYFAGPFNNAMKVLLANQDMESAAVWLRMLRLTEPMDEEQALQHTRLFLEDALRLFRNLNDQSYLNRAEELKLWRKPNWCVFINSLPDAMLHYVDELATEIINFTVRIEKKDRKLAYELSKGLCLLQHVNYSLKQLIKSNHEVFKGNYKSNRIFGRMGTPPGYILLLIIFFVLKTIADSDSCNNQSTSFNSVSFLQESSLDSLLVDGELLPKLREGYDAEMNRRNTLSEPFSLKGPYDFGSKPLYLRIAGGDGKSLSLENELAYPVKLWFWTERGMRSYNMDAESAITIDRSKDGENWDFVINLSLEGYNSLSDGDSIARFQLLELKPLASVKSISDSLPDFAFVQHIDKDADARNVLKLYTDADGIKVAVKGALKAKHYYPLLKLQDRVNP